MNQGTITNMLTLVISPVSGMEVRIVLVTVLFLITTLAPCVGCP